MADEPVIEHPAAAPEPASSTGQALWSRIREHKIIQWAVAYLGAALALGQGQQLVAEALDWPASVERVFVLALIAGFPLALTLAWYHGHRGLKRTSEGELAIVSVLLLIAALFFTVALPPASERASPSAPTVTNAEAAPTTRPTPLPNSIAVLPFENLSPDPANAHFAIGIHDELLNQLGKLSRMSVTARTSVMQYRDTELTIPDIARELNVETVMEASVSYAEGRIVVRARLIDAATGVRLWSESYNRVFDDIIAIQADIAMNIANALRVEFSTAEQEALERRPTSSIAAYTLYLEARTLMAGGAAGGLLRAHELLDGAIALDRQFGRAYAFKAALYTAQLVNTAQTAGIPPAQRADLEREIRDNAQRAMEIEPDSPMLRGAIRASNSVLWRWSAATEPLEPGDERELAPIQVWTFSYVGKHAEAIEIGERMRALRPNEGDVIFALAVAYAYAGDRAKSSALL